MVTVVASRKSLLCWSDGSVFKSTDYSSRVTEFNSQQPYDGSQPSLLGSHAPFYVSENRYIEFKYIE